MKKYDVKRYLESVDPAEISPEDRDYKESFEELEQFYAIDQMKKVSENIYLNEEDEDIYWVKNDENGYYVETFTCVQNEEIDEEEELFELFKFKFLKKEEGVYVSAHNPELDPSEYEECILLVKEKEEE